eukprot:g30820.t1
MDRRGLGSTRRDQTQTRLHSQRPDSDSAQRGSTAGDQARSRADSVHCRIDSAPFVKSWPGGERTRHQPDGLGSIREDLAGWRANSAP